MWKYILEYLESFKIGIWYLEKLRGKEIDTIISPISIPQGLILLLSMHVCSPDLAWRIYNNAKKNLDFYGIYELV